MPIKILTLAVREGLENYKKFLLNFVKLEHNFTDIDISNLDKLPAIKWKLQNLEKLKKQNKDKFEKQAVKLAEYFER